MQTSRGAAFREPPGIYQCMKETTGRIATARRRGTTRVKDRTRSPSRRVRSGTLGRDSTDVTAATAAAGQSACRAMTHPAAGASCKLSRVVQPAVSRQPWYRHDQCFAFDGTGAEKKGRKKFSRAHRASRLAQDVIRFFVKLCVKWCGETTRPGESLYPRLISNMRIRKDAPCLVLRLVPFENLDSWSKPDFPFSHLFNFPFQLFSLLFDVYLFFKYIYRDTLRAYLRTRDIIASAGKFLGDWR